MRLLVPMLLALGLVMCSACSWQQVINESHNQAGQWRLLDRYHADHNFRWRLPAAAQIEVLPTQQVVSHRQKSWLAAAQQGVDQVFLNPAVAAAERPHYFLAVQWPYLSEPESEALAGGKTQTHRFSLLGLHTWPDLPETGVLRVHLLSVDGEPIYQASLDVSARLWGQDWHHHDTLTRAFFQLAQNLRGS